MNSSHPIIVIGGGHAAVQLCAGLVEAGQGARVHLVCEEPILPYQRPPLSKSFLKNSQEQIQFIRTEDWYSQSGITVHLENPAIGLQRDKACVVLRSGVRLPYAYAVLATGTRARRLNTLPSTLDNVSSLRAAQDALAMRERFANVSSLSVLGGGFIGLELAATARTMGKQVSVLESAPRLLARSVSAELAQHVLETHRAAGIDVRLGVRVDDFIVQHDCLTSVVVDGYAESVEWLVLGIGAEPEVQLAQQSGLTCDNGILVDAYMRTSDPTVLAIGDCANFPVYAQSRRLRLESVQNANDHARTAVATLLGREEPYQALPWFWSEQGTMRLQMAGLIPDDAIRYRRPGTSHGSFSILHYQGDRLACVESVNAPMDHMAARKLLETGTSPGPKQAMDSANTLKSFL